MTFVHFCVGFVVCLGIMLVTLLCVLIIDWPFWNGHMDSPTSIWLAWFFSSVGFAICLTILLYQNGII